MKFLTKILKIASVYIGGKCTAIDCSLHGVIVAQVTMSQYCEEEVRVLVFASHECQKSLSKSRGEAE